MSIVTIISNLFELYFTIYFIIYFTSIYINNLNVHNYIISFYVTLLTLTLTGIILIQYYTIKIKEKNIRNLNKLIYNFYSFNHLEDDIDNEYSNILKD